MKSLRILREGVGKAPILENKIQEFQEREDYTLSFGENGERIYIINSQELKRVIYEINDGEILSPYFKPETWDFVVVVGKDKGLNEKNNNSEKDKERSLMNNNGSNDLDKDELSTKDKDIEKGKSDNPTEKDLDKVKKQTDKIEKTSVKGELDGSKEFPLLISKKNNNCQQSLEQNKNFENESTSWFIGISVVLGTTSLILIKFRNKIWTGKKIK